MIKEKDMKKIAIEFRESNKFSKISNAIIKRFNKIKYGQDVMPCLRFMEWVFGVKNKGLNLDKQSIVHWPKIFIKCEDFLIEYANQFSDYATIILRETLAHRYSDYYRFYRKYEDRFNNHYNFSFSKASELDYGLHKDGSMFWNGVAYNRCNEISKASFFFKIVVLNRLDYSDIRMPILKVQSSFDFFEKNIDMTPDQMSVCVYKLKEQNDKLAKLVGINNSIPEEKINRYINLWCVKTRENNANG